jgi:hypothetical protein
MSSTIAQGVGVGFDLGGLACGEPCFDPLGQQTAEFMGVPRHAWPPGGWR